MTKTEDLRATLRLLSDGFRKLRAHVGAWLMEEFVLLEGIDCIAQPLPRRYRRRLPKQCFANAAALVRRVPGLIYVEGYVASPRVPFPVHHAWAIDADHAVIDPTLGDPELCAYVGVPVTREDYVARTRQGNSASMFLDEIGVVRVEWITQRCPALREMMDP